MNFISRDTDYAVRALMFMARASKKGLTTVDEIVEKVDLPERFLRRILQKLAKKKILASHKGKMGGFSFFRPPSAIRFTDVIEVFQGKVDLTNCFLKGRTCPNSKRSCPLKRKLIHISGVLNKELGNITVASLLKG